MLYDLIIIILALVIPTSAYLAFRAGYRTGRAVKEEKEIPSIIHKPKSKNGPPEQLKKLNAVLANIDSYDGSTEGQVKL